jgi:hypothetical protein
VVYDTACVSAAVNSIAVKFLVFQIMLCKALNTDFNTVLFRFCASYVYYFCSINVKPSVFFDFVGFVAQGLVSCQLKPTYGCCVIFHDNT